MMSSRYQLVLVIAAGLCIGWLCGGEPAPDEGARIAEDIPVMKGGQDDAEVHGKTDAGPAWENEHYKIGQLEKVPDLPHSPIIEIPLFSPQGEQAWNALKALAEWEGLDAAQTVELKRILDAAKKRQIDWEKREIRVEMTRPGVCLLHWKPAPAEIRRAFQDDLKSSFGEQTALSLWQKGDLGHFADFGGHRVNGGTIEVTFEEDGENQYQVRFDSPGFSIRAAMHVDPGKDEQTLGMRFDHLVDPREVVKGLNRSGE